MIEHIIRHYVHDDYKNVHLPSVRRAYGIFAAVFGLITNIILVGMKLTIGFITKQMSIVADGVNSLSDFLSCFLTIFAFVVSAKPADAEHPYGHERMEYIIAMIFSVVIFLLGIVLGYQAVSSLINPDPVNTEFPLISVIILGISVLLKGLQCAVYFYIALKIESMIIKDNGKDSRNDVFSTLAVLFGQIIMFYTGYARTDGILTLLVAVYIVIEGIKMLYEAGDKLLGSKPSAEEINDLVKLIKSHPGIYGVHDLEMHSYGPNQTFASVHVEVDGTKDMFTTHELIDNIEDDCLHRLNIHTTIHMDPIRINDPETEHAKTIVKEALNAVDPKLTFHDFRISKDSKGHVLVIFDMVIPYSKEKKHREIKEEVIQEIKKRDSALKPVINLDDQYAMIMQDND